MSHQSLRKPGIEEWLSLAEAVIDRTTTCVHTYNHPPEGGGFMPEAERQRRTNETVGLLRRIHALVDQAEIPTDSIPLAHQHDERIVDGLALLFRETLRALPQLSEDMQKLMASPWQKNFPNVVARTLFLGSGNEAHGIGSGHPEHGRMPEVLVDILEREQMGEARYPRAALLKQGEPRRHDVEARQRWAASNGSFLRSAGRVE